jgi:dolichol-phosphate mannosyltransferase
MISVVLPTYNEREAIVAVVTEVLAVARQAGLEVEVVVVDDASPDGTAFHLGETFRDEPAVRVWVRRGERGLAGAVRRGLEEARGEILAVMDADGNHDPSLLPLMVRLTDQFDVVVGSRFVPGGGMPISAFRASGSRAFNLLVRLALGLPVWDSLSGYLALRRTWLGRLDADRVFVGYGDYAIRLLYHTAACHGRILELPTVYRPRKGGTSKTRLRSAVFTYLGTVARLRLGR